ncbi:FAD-dependent oxidoreductase [Chryseobacterium carnipullorum]|uniref:FAD-dependent oxidoreductase n=1 Tax=Chryseobacterium carnipullorum TaxID=1124835 RepID=UPI0009120579|nr:FAD-dependent oxidoreductase [Chryseobacterium carnipullorum]SHM44557.1 sarcosine oxidase/sarcosine oxidase / L-pipecolate oxidase [Chryseobacterium carnipullorum]HBV15841.1 FAD-dependent oxidoreductase [Chryseobacterium carnipullorum]
MKTENYDVIVIGGGAIGLATAYHLGQRKADTLVLEQFTFVNQLGSSAGVSRQFRIPYPDEYMVKMALEAQPYWDALEKEANKSLLDKVGTLWFGDPEVHSTEGNIAEAEKALQALDVPYTTLTSKEIEEKYQFKNLPENYTGLFQPDGASINFKATIETLLDLCKKEETVQLEENSPVLDIKQIGELFEITTPNGIYIAKKLAIIPGPYINSVINLLDFKIEATYWNMSSAYFKKTDPTIQYPTWFVFQNAIGENGNQFYGFPSVDWDHPEYIRVAPDFVITPLEEPSDRTLIPNPQELAYTSEWVQQHMTGLGTEPEYTSTCLIALSTIPNKELLIDFAPKYVPNYKNIVVYATGWAAKFTPFLGKIMSDLALDGHTDFDISHFQLGRKFFKSI